MNPKRWQQVEQIYHTALEREAGQRAAFLATACAGDDSLRREIESLLAHQTQAENFMVAPAVEVAAKAIADGSTIGVIGQTFDHYQILSLLGKGGMGEVYRARDTRLGREVAVKVLPAEYSADADRLRRFEQEARAVGMLNHPNILTIHDIGTVSQERGRAPYIVSELLAGATLREQLRGAVLPLRRAIDCAVQIARGLAAAHEKGIVHRDLKPENLFITKDGRVKILDFGLAKLRQKTLTDDQINWQGARWFPDGKRILLNGNEPGQGLRSYILDLEGGKPRPVTPERIAGRLVSPDGQWLITSGPQQKLSLSSPWPEGSRI